MEFSTSLKKNQQFRFVYQNGKSYANKYLVMYVKENGLGKNRLGISVSKKVGNSVVRHRVTRLVRESYRLHEKVFNSGLDIVIVARPSAATVGYHEVERALLHLGKLHQVIFIGMGLEAFIWYFIMKKVMIAGIRFYQKYISPMKRTKCPYIPTCSQYGLEAIQKYGAVKGGALAVWRILRCNPFSKGGYDPVP